MYNDTLAHFAHIAEKKVRFLKYNPSAFFIGAMMAGAYVGLGIILIFSVAATIDPMWQKLVMGLSFGIALTLVMFAGGELFTGHTMYMVIGYIKGLTGVKDLARIWCVCWFFNLVGALILVAIFIAGGGGGVLGDGIYLLNKVAAYKMNSGALELFARAILCNWLVCLSLWMAARTSSDSAKAIVIFWCLFAFIASGYEHSVANMTLLSLALAGHPNEAITIGGLVHNLFWVTLGNIIGGGIFMGAGYWAASGKIILDESTNLKSSQLVKDEVFDITIENRD